MGQEACKAAWPKPSGGYQTITGRRYGRRHAYISFRPSLESPNRSSTQQGGENEGLELDNVQKEKERIFSESHDSSLFTIGSVLTADLQESRTFDANDSLSVFTEAEQNAVSPFSMSEHVRCQILNNSTDCKKSTTTFVRHASMEHPHRSNQNGISFVNIDSFEPDSSEGEETVSHPDDISLKCEAGKQQNTMHHMFSEIQKASCTEKLSELSKLNHDFSKESLSQVRPESLAKQCNIDICTTPWNLSASPVPEDVATGVANIDLSESQHMQHKHELTMKSSIGICNEINTCSAKTGNTNEPVVRPKIRKPISSISSGKDPLITEEIGKEAKHSRRGNRETLFSVEKTSKEEKVHSSKDTRVIEGARKKMTGGNKNSVSLQEDKPLVEDTFWDDFEVYGMKLSDSTKDEDSSDFSDGEWTTCLPSYFSGDKDHSSSDESWETLPGKDEHEVQSNSSSLEEENSEFCFQVEEQTSLEDGEIPWLQYHEDIESSTDEENEMGTNYLPPGFFILDGNNNLEDDSSMSEDLEVEWRLLDDFGDGIGVAQAMSYMDPQFLTYMALEERLAQAMETALAHLESLAVDVEQAHPPATKESIECLPQIVVTDDHIIVGQEQCCAICCSEYLKEEVLTELPCHHLFHKPCVTLWLQKSGTCPVCRHVLTSFLPEAAAATSFLSDHDTPPSIHNAAGTR